jgi:hypothetical protein
LTTFFFSSSAAVATTVSQQFSAYFVDGFGRRVGIVLGKVYNEIPNAQIGFLRGAPAQWSPLGMPMLSVPANVNGSLRITGVQNIPINITAFGKGKVVALQNLLVDTQVASEIRLDQVGSTVAIASATQSTPDIYVGYSEDQQSVEMTAKRIVLQKGTKAVASANKQTKTLAMLTSDRQFAQVRVSAADSTQPVSVSSQTTVATDDQSLAPIIDALAPAPVQASTAQPTVMPMPSATPIPHRNPPRPSQTVILPTRLRPTSDASTANSDVDGNGSSNSDGVHGDSSGDGSTVVTGTVDVTPTDITGSDNGDSAHVRPTWSSGDGQPTHGNDGGDVRPTPSSNDNGNDGDVRPTPGSGDNGDGGQTRPTPGSGDNGDGGRTRPTPGGGDNGDGGRTRPTPGGGDNGGNGRNRPTPERHHHGDNGDNGDTTGNNVPDNSSDNTNLQSPTAISEDQPDIAPIDATPVPTKNTDDAETMRQYVSPTVVVSTGDGVGELRE